MISHWWKKKPFSWTAFLYYKTNFHQFKLTGLQGKTLEGLIKNLKEIYRELNSGTIPNVYRVGEVEIAWNEQICSKHSKSQAVFWYDMEATMTGIKIPQQKWVSPYPGIVRSVNPWPDSPKGGGVNRQFVLWRVYPTGRSTGGSDSDEQGINPQNR